MELNKILIKLASDADPQAVGFLLVFFLFIFFVYRVAIASSKSNTKVNFFSQHTSATGRHKHKYEIDGSDVYVDNQKIKLPFGSRKKNPTIHEIEDQIYINGRPLMDGKIY